MPNQAYNQITQKAIQKAFDDQRPWKIFDPVPFGAKLVTIRINQANDNLVLVWEHETFPESEGIQKVSWMELPKVK